MLVDQRPRVVDERLLRNAAEVRERSFEAVEPRRLPFVPERLHEDPPRIAERRHEQMDPHGLAAHIDPRLAEVDLKLPPRRRLEPHAGPRLRPQRLAKTRHRPLDRAQRYRHTKLARQVLPHHVGVAPMAPEPLLDKIPEPVQRLRAPRRPVFDKPARLQVTPHGLVTAAELGPDPPNAPAQRLQPHHRHRLVRRPHQVPPQIVNPRRTFNHSVHLQTSSHSEGVQFLMSPRVQFSLSPDRWTHATLAALNEAEPRAAAEMAWRRGAAKPKPRAKASR